MPSAQMFRDAFVRLVVERVGCEPGCFVHKCAGAAFEAVGNDDAMSDEITRHIGRYLSQMEPEELRAVAAGRTILDSEVFSVWRRDRLDLYGEFLASRGYKNYVIRMWSDAGQIYWICFPCGRYENIKRFSQRLMLLDSLIPVVAMAERLHRLRAQASASAPIAPVNEALDLSNATLGRGELALLLGAAPTALGRRLRRRTDSPHGGLSTALLSESNFRISTTEGTLRQRFGLTLAEVALARQLAAEPLPLSETAELLGISVNTAKKHLQRVFAKTSTHRQSELIKFVIEIEAECSEEPP